MKLKNVFEDTLENILKMMQFSIIEFEVFPARGFILKLSSKFAAFRSGIGKSPRWVKVGALREWRRNFFSDFSVRVLQCEVRLALYGFAAERQ